MDEYTTPENDYVHLVIGICALVVAGYDYELNDTKTQNYHTT